MIMNNEEIETSGVIAIDTSKDEIVSNEPKRTIFEDIKDFNFYNCVDKVIKFNSYFSKIGFERVNKGKDFSIYTFYPQLTLMIIPTLVLPYKNDYDDEEDNKEVIMNMIKIRKDEWEPYFWGKSGFFGTKIHWIVGDCKEEIETLKIKYKDKELILGHYLKERNIVILYINPFDTDLTIENNEYLDLVLKLFEDKMKDIKLKKVDVTENLKNAFAGKFKKEIEYKLNEAKSDLKRNEDNISNLQINLLEEIKKSKLNRNQLECLISFNINVDNTIKKGLEEIKTISSIKNIRLTSAGIGLDIGSIYIKHNEDNVYIGDFYLIISPEAVKIYCKNPIINKDGLEVFHPHIDGNHNCYGGEREQKIIEYLSNFDLKKLILYIQMFLKTYTANDSYNNISMWLRDDLKRKDVSVEINNNDDISNISFQGDYFTERLDRGDSEDSDDENSDDEDSEDECLGDCEQCGTGVYENDEYWVRGNDDQIFCSNECRDTFQSENR